MYLGSHHSLEFLSLACSGLGSGSDYVTLFYTYVTLSLSIIVVIDPISLENRIWGDRIGTCLV
jgi:hypothetical protein